MKRLNIAIIGLGNIGSYLYKYLNDNKKILTKKNNCLPLVKYVSAKNRKRKRNIVIKKKQWLNNYLAATSSPFKSAEGLVSAKPCFFAKESTSLKFLFFLSMDDKI